MCVRGLLHEIPSEEMSREICCAGNSSGSIGLRYAKDGGYLIQEPLNIVSQIEMKLISLSFIFWSK